MASVAAAIAALVSILLLGVSGQTQNSSQSMRGSASKGSNDASNKDVLKISHTQLLDKIDGFWVGQLVGNFMGLPFEFVYNDHPMKILPKKYYDVKSAREEGLKVNDDGRGRIPQRLNELQGAYTDDDTDIEFVTLHAVKEHGLDLSYPQIRDAWVKYVHIHVNGNDALWFANKVARQLMDQGVLPPATGSKKNNKYWWTIDPQLVNEIWSAFYPGMLDMAVKRAQWGAEITSDSWGTHPTRFYAALYSAAFFTSDVNQLYEIGMRFVPSSSLFLQGLWDVKSMYQDGKAWREAWYALRSKYVYQPGNCGSVPWNCGVSAMINGVMGALAFLYGGGDFEQTVGIAIAAGYDCDNQAATLAGLIGVMHGGSKIPRSYTHEIAGNQWSKAFNDKYVNERRQPLPKYHTNTDIIGNITAMARRAILDQGGSELKEAGQMTYLVKASDLLTGVGGPAPPLKPPPVEVGCCALCKDMPYCSDVSGTCKWTKKKTYYRSCGCCNACPHSPFCSPKSKNCYNWKKKDYYHTCSK